MPSPKEAISHKPASGCEIIQTASAGQDKTLRRDTRHRGGTVGGLLLKIGQNLEAEIRGRPRPPLQEDQASSGSEAGPEVGAERRSSRAVVSGLLG